MTPPGFVERTKALFIGEPDKAAKVLLLPSVIDDLLVSQRAFQKALEDFGRDDWAEQMAEELSAGALFLERLELAMLEAREALSRFARARKLALEAAAEGSDEPAPPEPPPPPPAPAPANGSAMEKIKRLF